MIEKIAFLLSLNFEGQILFGIWDNRAAIP